MSVILSTSYSDAEFRGTVGLLDSREIKNDSQTRRRFRLDLQKEVIERNGEILDGFSSVSEVSITFTASHLTLKMLTKPATTSHQGHTGQSEYSLC